MRGCENVPTQRLWEAIEENARRGQAHVNWIEYLDNIKVLCAMIDERVELFRRKKRTEQLWREHRGVFRLDNADEASETGPGVSGGGKEPSVLVRGGDGAWIEAEP